MIYEALLYTILIRKMEMNKIIYLIINLGIKIAEILLDKYLKKDATNLRNVRYEIKRRK